MFFASELRQSRQFKQRVRGRIYVERKERLRVGRRLVRFLALGLKRTLRFAHSGKLLMLLPSSRPPRAP